MKQAGMGEVLGDLPIDWESESTGTATDTWVGRILIETYDGQAQRIKR
jgi:hypothetical protein